MSTNWTEKDPYQSISLWNIKILAPKGRFYKFPEGKNRLYHKDQNQKGFVSPKSCMKNSKAILSNSEEKFFTIYNSKPSLSVSSKHRKEEHFQTSKTSLHIPFLRDFLENVLYQKMGLKKEKEKSGI